MSIVQCIVENWDSREPVAKTMGKLATCARGLRTQRINNSKLIPQPLSALPKTHVDLQTSNNH